MAMLPAHAPPEREPVHENRSRRAGGLGRGLAGRSDERLVEIAHEGDERAFGVLYERHSAAIVRYCRSLMRSPQEAEDVTQEVFVLAISALRRGADPDAFRPWLYRVAHNACMSYMRTRRPVLVADNGVLVGPAAVAEPVDVHREDLRQLLDDIGSLPDVQRGALLLREMDGFSYEQVGEVLGLAPSTVRASIFRARRTLQGLAEARDADCDVIQSELSELADRRGRRARHITSHLHVCPTCRDFRDGLRRRPAVLGAADPVGPAGVAAALVAVKGKLLGGATAGGGAGAAMATGAGGAAGVAKMSAVVASSIALLAGAGLEAERVIERSHQSGAAAVTRAAERGSAGTARPGDRDGAAPWLSIVPGPGGFGLRASAPAAARRPATAEGSTRARTRDQAASAAGMRDDDSARPQSTADAPATASAPESLSDHADSGERGSSGRDHGSGRRDDQEDRSGRSSERAADESAARLRASEPRSAGTGSGPSAPGGNDDHGPTAPTASSSGSSGSSGPGSSTPQARPVDDKPAPAPPGDDSGPSAPVLVAEPSDEEPAPPADPTAPADPGDDPAADVGPAEAPPGDANPTAADARPATP